MYDLLSMTWGDGLASKHFGATGLLLTDSLASMTSAILLVILLRKRLKKPRGDETETSPATHIASYESAD